MSHHNTLFSQMLSLIPRHVFQKLEHRHKVGRASRKFGFKEQFTAMAFSRAHGFVCGPQYRQQARASAAQ